MPKTPAHPDIVSKIDSILGSGKFKNILDPHCWFSLWSPSKKMWVKTCAPLEPLTWCKSKKDAQVIHESKKDSVRARIKKETRLIVNVVYLEHE